MDPLLTQGPILLFAAMVISFAVVLGFVSITDALKP